MIRIRLSRILGEMRWTQKDLVKKTDIRAATINAIYNELCERVSLEHLDRICEATGRTLADLLEYTPNKIPLEERIHEK